MHMLPEAAAGVPCVCRGPWIGPFIFEKSECTLIKKLIGHLIYLRMLSNPTSIGDLFIKILQ